MRTQLQSLFVTGLLVLGSLLVLTVLGVSVPFPSRLGGSGAFTLFAADEILQVPIVMVAGCLAGVIAMWLYESRNRMFWVLCFAVVLAFVCAAAVPVAGLELSPRSALAYRASVAFFCALAVTAGSALTALAGSLRPHRR